MFTARHYYITERHSNSWIGLAMSNHDVVFTPQTQPLSSVQRSVLGRHSRYTRKGTSLRPPCYSVERYIFYNKTEKEEVCLRYTEWN